MNTLIQSVKGAVLLIWAFVIVFIGQIVFPILMLFGYQAIILPPATELDVRLVIAGSWLSIIVATLQTKAIITHFFKLVGLDDSWTAIVQGFALLLILAAMVFGPLLVGFVIVYVGRFVVPSGVVGERVYRSLFFVAAWLVICVAHTAVYRMVAQDPNNNSDERVIRGRRKLEGPQEAQQIADRNRRRQSAELGEPSVPFFKQSDRRK